MSDLQNHILIVDDEFMIVELLTIYVEDMGWQVCGSAATADDAVALAQKYRPSVVLMDMRLKGARDGVDAALDIHQTVGSAMVFITGSSEPSTLARIFLGHPSSVLIKPVTEHQVGQAVEKAMRDLGECRSAREA